jgi:3-dehydroquinate synthase
LAGISEPSWTADRLMAHMGQDKKVRAGRLTFILAKGIGQSFVTQDVDSNMVLELLKEALAA